MADPEVLILTGAGASLPVGIQAMRGMAKEFADSVRGSREAQAYKLLRELGAGEDVEELLQLANQLTSLNQNGVTKLVETCVAPREGEGLKRFRSRLQAELAQIASMRTELIKFITYACLRFNRAKADSYFGEIVELAASRECPIFTTNYDGVFEEVAGSRGVEVADNFLKDGQGRYFWDSDINSFFRGGGITLIHIHGSVHWHATERGVIERIRQPATLSVEGLPLEQLLIFPTRFKDIYSQVYFPLYSLFVRLLDKARLLVVVGHSLRDEYIRAAVRERVKDSAFRLVVVDPGSPYRFDEIAGACATAESVLHLKRGVEEAFPVLVQLLREPDLAAGLGGLTDAVEDIRLGRKSKVVLKLGDKGWTSAGLELKADLLVRVVNSAARLEVLKREGGRWTPIEFAAADKEFTGSVTKSQRIVIHVPKNLTPGSHVLKAQLSEVSSGRALASDVKKLRIRK